MPVGPITYLTTSDLLSDLLIASCEQKQHPLIRLLLSHLLAATLECPSEDAARTQVNTLIGQVQETCCMLTDTLRQRHPSLPSDPEEQAWMWQEAMTELLSVWGYHDITTQVHDWYETYAHERGEPTRFDARLVLKSSTSVQYIHTLAQLLITLDDARQTAAEQPQDERETPSEEDDDAPRL